MTSYENKKPSKIIGIQFSILSPHEIQKGSVAEIIKKVNRFIAETTAWEHLLIQRSIYVLWILYTS